MKKFIGVILFTFLSLTTFANAEQIPEARLVTDNGPMGNHSWVLKGIETGTFIKHGVKVTYSGAARGGVNSGLAISKGVAELGYIDFSAVVMVNGKFSKPKIKAIFVVDDKSQDGIYVLESSKIKTWDDIANIRLGGFPTSVVAKVIPIVTDSKPNYINMPFNLRVPSLVSGQVDAIEGFLTTNKFNLEKAGVKNFKTLQIGDTLTYSVSRVIALNSEWAEANPNAVKGLRAAIRELLDEHIKNPADSVKYLTGPLVSNKTGVDTEIARAKFNNDVLILTENVKKNGINNSKVLAPRLNKYIDVINENLALENKHNYKDYYTLD